MNRIVMVTGGTGYIGAWVVKLLLERGYTVRLTVRDLSRKEKYSSLQQFAEKYPGNLEIHEANLLMEGSFDRASRGAEAIIHIASPFTLRFKDARKDLIDPALLGTRNVLNAATRSGTVKKVVLTSSVAAIYGDNIDMKELGIDEYTEDHFNTTSSENHQPYSFSKTIAEQEAWNLAREQNSWKLIVKNPAMVLGPSLTSNSDSESLNIMKGMLKGKMLLGAPDISFGFVDVRDVAHAHVLALENDKVSGRHILSAQTMNMLQLSQIIKKLFPGKFRLPLMKAPKIVLLIIGRLFRVTPEYVKRNVGYPLRLNATKSTRVLGLKYRPIEDTIKDMVEKMQQQKMV